MVPVRRFFDFFDDDQGGRNIDDFNARANALSVVIPPAVVPGDSVGVVAASGPVDPALLARGLEFLQRKGFRVVCGRHTLECNGYLAGTDQQRCADLNSMLRDPHIRAVLFARGGYGIMRVLESLDYEAVKRDPKLVLGMSDVTALQLSLLARSRLVSLSGPLLAGQIGTGLDPLSDEWLTRALTEPLDARELLPPGPSSLRVLRSGTAHGVLLGGCLSLVTALLGTAHAPSFRGAILLLEDVNEPLYRIDRMLVQLKLAGVLADAVGVVLGHFVGPDGEDLGEAADRLVLETTADSPIPIISGFPHGHVLPNLTVPHGIPVELRTSPPSLRVSVPA